MKDNCFISLLLFFISKGLKRISMDDCIEKGCKYSFYGYVILLKFEEEIFYNILVPNSKTKKM